MSVLVGVTCRACGRPAVEPTAEGVCGNVSACIGARDGGTAARANQEWLGAEMAAELEGELENARREREATAVDARLSRTDWRKRR